MPKLTLSIDAEVIRRAKHIAKKRGTSVSAIFSQFVNALARQPEHNGQRPGPVTRKAIGLVDLPEDKADRELIEEALAERFDR